MKLAPMLLATLSLTIAQAGAAGDGLWIDIQGDAVIRRTDLGNDAPLPAGFVPIDLLSVSVQGWMPSSPATDLYSGSVIDSEADFVQIQIVVDGLASPPGPIGLNGFSYNPYQFGDRPITGFIDIDIDDQKDSGGELMPLAQSRYLANVARFGNSPQGSIAERIAQSGVDLDSDFFEGPEIERSGAEFSLIMCGCFSPIIISESGNMDSLFDAGETWIVEGRFFERFESFQPESALFGGSDFGLFDPTTTLQFVHDPIEDQTLITLVFPITNAGAALIVGNAEQPIDLNLNNQTSIEEALDDLIIGADFASGALGILTNDWREKTLTEYRVPKEWAITALIGTAPTSAQPSSFYVWTDTGFNEFQGDVNLDELNNAQDGHVIEDYIDDNDGTLTDGDSIVNGEVGIANFGLAFHFYDLNNDGVVSDEDIPDPTCPADLVVDGLLNFFDVSEFLILYAAQDSRADFFPDDNFNFSDVSLFLTHYGQGCP